MLKVTGYTPHFVFVTYTSDATVRPNYRDIDTIPTLALKV